MRCGSSRIAAYDAGLDFVGYEIDKHYFEKQEERFAAYTAQCRLFRKPPQEALEERGAAYQTWEEPMDLEQKAIERLKAASDMSLQFYKQPLVVTTSGGKDSSVCVALAERAERERDTAVKDIPKSCATCKEFEGGSCPILSYKDYQTDCEHWKWRGTKED